MHEVFAHPGVHRRFYFANHLFNRNNGLIGEVSAFFWHDLIFDLDCIRACPFNTWTQCQTFTAFPKPVSASTMSGRFTACRIAAVCCANSDRLMNPRSGMPQRYSSVPLHSDKRPRNPNLLPRAQPARWQRRGLTSRGVPKFLSRKVLIRLGRIVPHKSRGTIELLNTNLN